MFKMTKRRYEWHTKSNTKKGLSGESNRNEKKFGPKAWVDRVIGLELGLGLGLRSRVRV